MELEIQSAKLVLSIVDKETGEIITREATLGDFKEVKKASDAAYAEYEAHLERIRTKGNEIIKKAEEEGKPIFVLSGINYGYNAATDLQYSATVGAAFEAAFQGYHAIAISEGACDCHEVTDKYIKQVLKELLDKPLEMGLVHNVNFPGCTLSECKGILYDRKVSRGMFFKDTYDVVEELEDGGIRYMVNGHYNEENEPETDFRAITDNYVSVGVVNNIGF